MPKFDQDKLNSLKKIDDLVKAIYRKPKNVKVYPPINKTETQSIIIIGMMMIGDSIMIIPPLRVIKNNFPNAKITMAGTSVVQTILNGQGLVDEFIVVNSPWLSKNYSLKSLYSLFYKSVKIVNQQRYEVAIDLRGDWRNIFFMNFIDADRKISFNYSGGEYMLTDVYKGDDNLPHYIDEWLYLLKQIGCSYDENDRFPVLRLSADQKAYLAEFKNKNDLNNKLVIGIHPGASMAFRRWDEERYSELIQLLNKRYLNCAFVIFEGPNENGTIAKIEVALKSIQIQYVIVNTKLADYLTLINASNILISNDSGAGHIAAAYNIANVVIFGKADPETVKPVNKNRVEIISHREKLGPDKPAEAYLKSITVSEVYEKTSAMIDALQQNVNPN